MAQAIQLITLALLASIGLTAHADSLFVRLSPDASSPVISEVIATDKVLMDAAPVEGAPDWQRLEIPLSAQGYMPTEALSKNFDVVVATPVFLEPSYESALLVTLQANDEYEVDEAGEEWTSVKFSKTLYGYFELSDKPVELIASGSTTDRKNLGNDTDRFPLSVAPLFDPTRGTSVLALAARGQEEVEWKSDERSPGPFRGPGPQAAIRDLGSPALPEGMVASPSQVKKPDFAPGMEADPESPARLLSGTLVREIQSDGPVYPIHLQTPEGRLIAYVDLSEIFVPDFSPYLGEKVYVQGPVYPIENFSSLLVIVAQSIKLAE